MGGGYEQVGEFSDSYGKNVNNYTQGTMNMLGGNLQGFLSQLGNYTPGAGMDALGGRSGQISGLTQQLMGPYASNMLQGATAQGIQGALGAANLNSMDNSLYSGKAGLDVTNAASIPLYQAMAQLGGMQSNLAGNFGSSLLSGYQNMANLYGGLGGQAMGNMSQLSSPDWYNQSYAYKPGFGDYATQLLGTAMGAGTQSMMGGTKPWFMG